MTKEQFNEIIMSLTDEQKETIKAKCNWEHKSWLGVFNDWPSLFENENNKHLIYPPTKEEIRYEVLFTKLFS